MDAGISWVSLWHYPCTFSLRANALQGHHHYLRLLPTDVLEMVFRYTFAREREGPPPAILQNYQLLGHAGQHAPIDDKLLQKEVLTWCDLVKSTPWPLFPLEECTRNHVNGHVEIRISEYWKSGNEGMQRCEMCQCWTLGVTLVETKETYSRTVCRECVEPYLHCRPISCVFCNTPCEEVEASKAAAISVLCKNCESQK